jgi:DnaJ homolog subfamily C member 19
LEQASPLIAGIAVAAAAYAGKYGIQAWQAFKARPPALRKFYEGGFQPTMTKREAALILGVRYFHFCFVRFQGIDCVSS